MKKILIIFCFFHLCFKPALGSDDLDQHKEHMMLIDSVLSLIKNYYVDRKSLTDGSMLFGTIDRLALDYPVSYIEQKDRIKVIFNDKFFFLPKTKNVLYKNLLEGLFLLSFHLDEYRVSLRYKDILSGTLKFMDLPPRGGAFEVLDALNASLDAHSSLMSVEEFQDLKQGTEGVFGGIGVMVGMKNHVLTIMDVIEDSPAKKKGIRKYDQILSIDGRDAFETSLDELIQFMKGAPGTKVRVELLRQDTGQSEIYSIVRELIQVKSVETKTFERKGRTFFYASIESFSQKVTEELKKALLEFQKLQPIEGVILDLRSNPGGLLDQAVSLSDLFIEKGVIVSTRGRFEEQEETKDDWRDESYPMVVLMNQDSASASEIVAGALQDHKRALIIGQPSFGKGSVQTLFDLPKERALKLTISRYYTPSGRSIQNIGITPDLWLQPIEQSEKNQNLLGYGRYKNERFLDHHLDNQSLIAHQTEIFKGYYLLKKKEDKKEHTQDEELALALIFLENSQKNLTLDTQLKKAWPSILSYTSKLEKDAQDFLKQTFQVHWKPSEHKPVIHGRFAIPGQKVYRYGDQIKIPYEIETEDLAERVSVFARGQREVGTTEVLLGAVDHKKKGVLTLDVDRDFPQDRWIHLDLGFAMDSLPLNMPDKHRLSFKVEKLKEEYPFKLIYELDDQKSGHKLRHQLEVKENAFLEVRISKESTQSFLGFDLTMENLSGSQVVLASKDKWIQDLTKKDKWVIKIPIQGGKEIKDPDLRFGLELVHKGDPKPMIRQTLHIKGS